MANEEFDITSVMKTLMNDPSISETIKKLKESTVGANEAKVENIVEEVPALEAMSKIISSNEVHSVDANSSIEMRNKLLSALKPYLRESRRDIIDTVMSLSKLTGILDVLPKGK